MASRVLFNRISLSSARPLIQQSRSIKYTTKFALDRKAVKDHAHHTAGRDPRRNTANTRHLAKGNPVVRFSIMMLLTKASLFLQSPFHCSMRGSCTSSTTIMLHMDPFQRRRLSFLIRTFASGISFGEMVIKRCSGMIM